MQVNNHTIDARGAVGNGGALGLSKRLLALADAVRPRSRVADVGCDHGKLAAFLVLSGKCESAVSTDINERPLAKACALFKERGISDRCLAVLCDGLDGVEPHSADDVVIAGLGADVIIEVIARTHWLRDESVRLVLCPSTRHAKLREWLYKESFEISSERAVREDGYCYTVITARFSRAPREISPGFAAVGLITGSDADSAAYRARQARRAQKLLRSGASEDKKRDARQALDYIREVEQQ